MRAAARSSARSASLLHFSVAASNSPSGTRNVVADKPARSYLLLSSANATSPRARTSATIERTTFATSPPSPRSAFKTASNCAVNSGARASSRRTMSVVFVCGPAARGPWTADIRKTGVYAFDLEFQDAAARKNQLHSTCRIIDTLWNELDREQ